MAAFPRKELWDTGLFSNLFFLAAVRGALLLDILSPFALSYHSPKATGLNFPRYVHAHTGEYLM